MAKKKEKVDTYKSRKKHLLKMLDVIGSSMYDLSMIRSRLVQHNFNSEAKFVNESIKELDKTRSMITQEFIGGE
jgi:hypothetical protein